MRRVQLKNWFAFERPGLRLFFSLKYLFPYLTYLAINDLLYNERTFSLQRGYFWKEKKINSAGDANQVYLIGPPNVVIRLRSDLLKCTHKRTQKHEYLKKHAYFKDREEREIFQKSKISNKFKSNFWSIFDPFCPKSPTNFKNFPKLFVTKQDKQAKHEVVPRQSMVAVITCIRMNREKKDFFLILKFIKSQISRIVSQFSTPTHIYWMHINGR